METEQHDVAVFAIDPGLITTAMTDYLANRIPDRITARTSQAAFANIAHGRFAWAEFSVPCLSRTLDSVQQQGSARRGACRCAANVADQQDVSIGAPACAIDRPESGPLTAPWRTRGWAPAEMLVTPQTPRTGARGTGLRTFVVLRLVSRCN